MNQRILYAGLLALCLQHHALALENKPAGTRIELSADARRSSSNDLFTATAFAEASDSNAATLARQVNQTINQGLALAKTAPDIKVKTGSSYTTPLYGKTPGKIEGWRMRSEIQLESKNAAALTELLGKLQASMAVSHLGAQPAPETASKAEADATIAALANFKERAALITAALGKKYRIVEMSISNGGRIAPYSMVRDKAMRASAETSMPIEAGESEIIVTITGKIELSD